MLPVGPRAEVERTLAGHLGRARKETTRTAAIQLLGDYFRDSEDAAQSVLRIAEDPDEAQELRQCAIRTLVTMRLAGGAVDRFARITEDKNPEIVLLVLDALRSLADRVRSRDVRGLLMNRIVDARPAVRQRAIELLGTFGELDVIEHVCMHPLTEPGDREAVRIMVERLLSKPRNVYCLRPDNFEHLVKQLLERMSFEEVRVTGRPGDGGIDVEAMVRQQTGSMESRRRVLVQCKRHRDPIGPEPIQTFASKTLLQAGAVQGLFITTSAFTENARQAVGSHRLELIDKEQLQQYLDKHFGTGLYCIRP